MLFQGNIVCMLFPWHLFGAIPQMCFPLIPTVGHDGSIRCEVSSSWATVAQPVYPVRSSTITVTRSNVASVLLISGTAYRRNVDADVWQQRSVLLIITVAVDKSVR